MTAQHTPERWEYDPDDDEIRDWHDGSVLFDGHNATNEQAVIAAAAPLMLEALRGAVSSLTYAADILEAPAASAFRENIANAQAAIRAATGEDA